MTDAMIVNAKECGLRRWANPKSVVIGSSSVNNDVLNIQQNVSFDSKDKNTDLKLAYKKFFLETIPITAVVECPSSENLFLTGNWNGMIRRWSISTLCERTQRLPVSDFIASQKTIPEWMSNTVKDETLLQAPLESYHWHSGPILKLKCRPKLPMLFFSVGLDRSIAFWDMTKHYDGDDNSDQQQRYQVDDTDVHLIAIHGGHRLISVFDPLHSSNQNEDLHPSLITSNDQKQEHQNRDYCVGGVINDVNWLAFDFPDFSSLSSSLTTTEVNSTTFGLTPGGSLFGGAILNGVSVDDNNLLQIWALSDDNFLSPEDNLPGKGRKEQIKDS